MQVYNTVGDPNHCLISTKCVHITFQLNRTLLCGNVTNKVDVNI